MNKHIQYMILPLILCHFSVSHLSSQEPNYDEDKIPPYTLPEIAEWVSGEPFNIRSWESMGRDSTLRLFSHQMYGKVPAHQIHMTHHIRQEKAGILEGLAHMKEVVLTFTAGDKSLHADLLIFLPNETTGPVPLFLGLNFNGNHTVHALPDITLPTSWVKNTDDGIVDQNTAVEDSRGHSARRWPVEDILNHGYGLAVMYCGDIDPDYDDGFQNGIHGLTGSPPSAHEWGAIAAWAWGLSRALDYMHDDEDVDHQRVAVIGHSRLGKTALWAGAIDPRFALVISNNSGCGGAALSRRRIGETLTAINSRFPYWFCQQFHAYNDHEDELPFDQHMLLAAIAPRPLYVASASEDRWADPRGEYTSLYHASQVYRLYEERATLDPQMPADEHPVHRGSLGYHLRTGRHDLTRYDWLQYIAFADRHLK